MSSSSSAQVLFICETGTWGSALAAALLRRQAGGTVQVRTGATSPGATISEAVLDCLGEVDAPRKGLKPSKLDPKIVAAADVIVTIGPDELDVPGAGVPVEHWPLAPAPASPTVDQARAARDELADLTTALFVELA